VSVQQALELDTISAARIASQERDRGSLEVGKLGDFVEMNDEPLAVDSTDIKDVLVEMSVIGRDVVDPRA
jgi:hypothetical protein